MITEALRRFLDGHRIDAPLVVAVSGGIDSTALLIALRELGSIELLAAHVNHHLRGAESDGDQAFVRDLCARLGVPLRVADGTLGAEAIKHRGVEAAAREVRYARLQAIRTEVGAKWIATAHQKNDQAETVLMRMRGIHPVRADGVIRPLLEVPRAEIERFLAARGVVARADSSNADPRFVRNRVRALVNAMSAEEIDRLASLGAEASGVAALLDRFVAAIEDVEVTPDQTRFRSLPDDPWLRQALLRRHIRRLDPEARDVDVVRLAAGVGGGKRISVSKNLEWRDGTLGRVGEPVPHLQFEIELTPEKPAQIPGGTMIIRQPATGNGQLIQLPTGAEPRFTVRNRRAGDRFQPLGFPHEKKLKDVLIDRKIAARVRDSIPLLVWNGAIVWVAGVEVSEKFKVTEGEGDRYEVAIEKTS